jgi:anti-sigma B factor antagonist
MTDAATLTLRTDHTADGVVVRCAGRLISTNADGLRTEVKPMIAAGRRIVLDLTDLTFMDSMGLGTLAALYVSSRTAGADLRLINVGRRIRDLFTVTHLLSLFESCGETNAIIP